MDRKYMLHLYFVVIKLDTSYVIELINVYIEYGDADHLYEFMLNSNLCNYEKIPLDCR